MKKNLSKQKVLDASIPLFFQKGFHGTSVRDIADEASVNVSLISYYFNGKQGLFEYAITEYYEQYLQKIEESLSEDKDRSAHEQLKQLVKDLLMFKYENFYLSCIIHRELALDSIFVREMIVTYLAKENFYFEELFKHVLTKHQISDLKLFMFQLKGMMMAPFMLHHEWRQNVVSGKTYEIFIDQFIEKIHKWIDHLIVR